VGPGKGSGGIKLPERARAGCNVRLMEQPLVVAALPATLDIFCQMNAVNITHNPSSRLVQKSMPKKKQRT